MLDLFSFYIASHPQLGLSYSLILFESFLYKISSGRKWEDVSTGPTIGIRGGE
jgi:hypothetical protein